MTTAHDLVRAALPLPVELRAGVVTRLPVPAPAQVRLAARIARTLHVPAQAAGAWVSTEALIRVRQEPETALRPVVTVVAGPLPYDGVVDEGAALAVETDISRLALWREADTATVWVVQPGGVVVAAHGRQSVVEPGGDLTLPGGQSTRVPAADLCRLVAVSG